MLKDFGQQLGEPDIQLSGLSIWIHQRQFPDATDYWDGNWLVITASCEASGASVWIHGPHIHLSEIKRLVDGVEQMQSSFSGVAELGCMEPEFDLKLKVKEQGRIEMQVSINPDHPFQSHRFKFEIDQSFLPKLIRECRKTLTEYPIKHDSTDSV